jgi:hypothetical protein
MRWKHKPKPELLTWRIVTKFAWFPVLSTIPTKEYIWLEFYKVNQQYVDGLDGKCWYDVQIAPKEYWND